ncbi:uncharacterized protein AB675_5374 [Cyphellophora attinorum]|uniref:Uncharacterized protein n=1 Tax=Cyphellophora attinorum TaxID=1664694 RepID=A0A0N0NNX9_9EURO|nr:uncharacterized protein AB675_5374 [Phialophora attinorum]KPI42101.1 hypothetical protein AB675_5374 [Phialophora attinorum]
MLGLLSVSASQGDEGNHPLPLRLSLRRTKPNLTRATTTKTASIKIHTSPIEEVQPSVMPPNNTTIDYEELHGIDRFIDELQRGNPYAWFLAIVFIGPFYFCVLAFLLAYTIIRWRKARERKQTRKHGGNDYSALSDG